MLIELTELASKEIERELSLLKTTKLIRIYISGFAWGGPRLGIALDEYKEGDILEIVNGISFIIEKGIVNIFSKFVINFSPSGLRKGFFIVPKSGNDKCE